MTVFQTTNTHCDHTKSKFCFLPPREKKEKSTHNFLSRFLSHAFSTFASRVFLFVEKITNKKLTPFGKLAKELKPSRKTKTLAKKFFLPTPSWQVLCFTTVLYFIASDSAFGQLPQTQAPTFNQFQQVNPSTPTNRPINGQSNTNNKVYDEQFKTSYTPPTVNRKQNDNTQHLLQYYSTVKESNTTSSTTKKQLWELKLQLFKFNNPTTENYKKLQPLYEAVYDSINQMLSGARPLDLKRATFLVENVFFMNKLNYADYVKRINEKVYIINQIIKQEHLNRKNNVALNYAIQQLYLKPVKYIDKNGAAKIHQPFKYDFNDPMGRANYSNQFTLKLLTTGSGQCHSMPLLYLILANEIGAQANLTYAPQHSYIAFSDNEGNYYNFECTSGGFTSYSFMMNSGFVKKEAIKNGIYMLPTNLKESIANQLSDLSHQHYRQFGAIDDFQLKCDKQSLLFYPNNVRALEGVSNYETAKTEVATCMAGWPHPKDIKNIPELQKQFDKQNYLYDYLDNLGDAPITEQEYINWLKSFNLAKAKQESEEIKKTILIKAKLNN